jgi:hypothetical protein
VNFLVVVLWEGCHVRANSDNGHSWTGTQYRWSSGIFCRGHTDKGVGKKWSIGLTWGRHTSRACRARRRLTERLYGPVLNCHIGGPQTAQSCSHSLPAERFRNWNAGGGGRFSAPVQTGSEAHPAFCTIGTGSFPGTKRQVHGVDNPTTSSAEVKERVQLYLYSPSRHSRHVLGWTLSIFTATIMKDRFKLNEVLKVCHLFSNLPVFGNYK